MHGILCCVKMQVFTTKMEPSTGISTHFPYRTSVFARMDTYSDASFVVIFFFHWNSKSVVHGSTKNLSMSFLAALTLLYRLEGAQSSVGQKRRR